MSFEIIAAQVIAILSPYLEKGAEKITESIAGDLWLKIKGIFKKKEKENLTTDLVENPTNPTIRTQAETVLHQAFAADPLLLAEIGSLLEKLKKANEINANINQTGNDNIAISGQISGTSINIQK
jgi:hypothetical protein